MKQLGYSGKGCGKKEKGVCVTIEPNTQEKKSGLGYFHSNIAQSIKGPSLKIKTIMCNHKTTHLEAFGRK